MNSLWSIPTPGTAPFTGQPGAVALVNRGIGKLYRLEKIEGRTWVFSHQSVADDFHGWWMFRELTELRGGDSHYMLIHPRELEQFLTTQDLDRKAYQWARDNQGFAGDYAAWQSLSATEREAYETGAGREPLPSVEGMSAQELLSEAAVEIANLDSPENPVAKRLRAMQEKIK